MPEKVERDFSDFQSPNEASVDRLIQAVDRAYHRPWLMMWRAFLQGLMAAIGASVGTILFVVASVYIFQLLGGIDLLKPTIDKLSQTVTNSVDKNLSNSGENLVSTPKGQ